MAFKKSKQYTSEEKYHYHDDRYFSPGKYGLKIGGPKHCYSDGFRDGFKGINNTLATEHVFGKRAGKAYARGRRRGIAAANDYVNKTGKHPSSLR